MSLNIITVDSHDYHVSAHENTESSTVYVYEATDGQMGEMVGSATLNHGMEMAHVDFPHGEETISYFEFVNKDILELARWVAGVAE